MRRFSKRGGGVGSDDRRALARVDDTCMTTTFTSPRHGQQRCDLPQKRRVNFSATSAAGENVFRSTGSGDRSTGFYPTRNPRTHHFFRSHRAPFTHTPSRCLTSGPPVSSTAPPTWSRAASSAALLTACRTRRRTASSTGPVREDPGIDDDEAERSRPFANRSRPFARRARSATRARPDPLHPSDDPISDYCTAGSCFSHLSGGNVAPSVVSALCCVGPQQKELKTKLGITEKDCLGDCLCVCCCHACAQCRIARELKARGIYTHEQMNGQLPSTLAPSNMGMIKSR